MLINKGNGTVYLKNDIEITPGLTKSQFLSSRPALSSREFVTNPPYESYICSVGPASPTIGGFTRLYFHYERLHAVQLIWIPDDLTVDWQSLEYQTRLKEFYPALLRTELGDPPYEYSWGTVRPGLDDRTGFLFTYIWLEYRMASATVPHGNESPHLVC